MISVSESRRTTQLPTFWRVFFEGREVVDRGDVAVADDHFRFAIDHRPDQLGDVATEVLVVGVSVDHDVGAELQAGVEAGLESGRQTFVGRKLHNVVNPALLRDFNRAIGRSVVNYQSLDQVDAVDRRGQVGQRGGEVCLLVQAGDLDHYLHQSSRLSHELQSSTVRVGLLGQSRRTRAARAGPRQSEPDGRCGAGQRRRGDRRRLASSPRRTPRRA